MDKFYEKNMADEGTSTNGKNLHGVKIVCQKKKKNTYARLYPKEMFNSQVIPHTAFRNESVKKRTFSNIYSCSFEKIKRAIIHMGGIP